MMNGYYCNNLFGGSWWLGFGLGFLMKIAFFVLLLLLIARLWKTRRTNETPSVREILAKRYASGELTYEEYLTMRSQLAEDAKKLEKE